MQSNQETDFLLFQQSTEEMAQAEIAALVQFAFFRPHLAELLEAVAGAELGLIVLKGAALAETVYARPSLRRFGDMDMLVHRAEAARAQTLLEGLGYIADPMQWEEIVRGRDCQANFFLHTERGSVVVELHTELINNDLFSDKCALTRQACGGGRVRRVWPGRRPWSWGRRTRFCTCACTWPGTIWPPRSRCATSPM